MNDKYANGEGDSMDKGGMTSLTGATGSGSFGKLKAKPIKSTGSRSFTRRKAVPKRSMGFSYKK